MSRKVIVIRLGSSEAPPFVCILGTQTDEIREPPEEKDPASVWCEQKLS